MQHFAYLTDNERRALFFIEPQEFDRTDDKRFLSHALGATLYMPAMRETIADDIISNRAKGLISTVFCLEDAIADRDLEEAGKRLLKHLQTLHSAQRRREMKSGDLPMIFIRVRNPQHLSRIGDLILAELPIICGFVFPKFSHHNGDAYFQELRKLNDNLSLRLYAMPILETPDIIYWETRKDSLREIADILKKYHDLVLNIRIGAVDFSSLFGIRRGSDVTVYDIQVIRDCMTDIINAFCRMDREYVVSGPVWEYFQSGDRVLKPQLRMTPFKQQYGEVGGEIRSRLLNEHVDGLIHETLLDKANGLIGKTVIHPSHIIPVQAMYVVNYEEYMDACSILKNNGRAGVLKSAFDNKMNEIKPHTNWAERILLRSKIYGVFNRNHELTNLLQ
jgi:citrate lyase beta subunit